MKKILVVLSLALAFAFSAPPSAAQGARYDNYALIGKLGGPVNITVCNTGQIQGGTAGLSESGTTVTVNLTSALTLTVGQFVTIQGASNSSYNGTFAIVAVNSSTQFTYTSPNSGLAASGAGQVMPANLPCTPAASIFADSALQTALANPVSYSGGIAPFGFYAAPGTYAITITGANAPAFPVLVATLPPPAAQGILSTGSITPAASSATIGVNSQNFTLTGVNSGDPLIPVSVPAPTALCPLVSARATANNQVTLDFSVLTAAACTPAPGTYKFIAVR